MYCTKCGAKNEPGMRYCMQCGARLGNTSHYSAPDADTADTATGQKRVSIPVYDTIKRFATSPLFLAAAICGSAALLLQIIYTASYGTAMNSIVSIFSSVIGSVGTSSAMNSVFGTLNTMIILVAIIFMAPAILDAIGEWMVYASARSYPLQPLKTAGLTIIKVVEIVMCCIYSAFFLLIEILLIAMTSSISRNGTSGALVALIIVLAFIIFLYIYYYVKLVQAINSMKESIQTGVPHANISAYVPVIAIIVGVVTVISTFAGSGYSNFLSVLSGLCTGACAILFAILLFQYRSRMRYMVSHPKSYKVADDTDSFTENDREETDDSGEASDSGSGAPNYSYVNIGRQEPQDTADQEDISEKEAADAAAYNAAMATAAREAMERQEREREHAVLVRKAQEEAERKAKEAEERQAQETAEREAEDEAERNAWAAAAREAQAAAERNTNTQDAAEREAQEAAEREAQEDAAREAQAAAEREARAAQQQPDSVIQPQAVQTQPQTAQQNEYVQQPDTQPVTQPVAQQDGTFVLGGAAAAGAAAAGAAAAAGESGPKLYLTRVKNNQVIPVDRDLFCIGKDFTTVHYVIQDNNAVSRQHANLIHSDGEYFLVDLNSTNHVYLNGIQISPGLEMPLCDGDTFLLGDEEFKVEIR